MIVDKNEMCSACCRKIARAFRYTIPFSRKAVRCQHDVHVHYHDFTVVLCPKCGGAQGRCCLCGEKRA